MPPRNQRTLRRAPTALLLLAAGLGCTTVVTRPVDFAATKPARAAAGCPDQAQDGDGNTYPTVLLGQQCWFATNLRVTRYRDGSAIGDAPEIDVAQYGRLYRFTHVEDPRGLCPAGWHVPSDAEVQVMERLVGLTDAELTSRGWRGKQKQARRVKLSATAFSWTPEEERTVNDTGLSIVAAGEEIGAFKGANGLYAGLWTSTADTAAAAWVRYFTWLAVNPRQDMIWRDSVDRARAYSVRCVLDAPVPPAAVEPPPPAEPPAPTETPPPPADAAAPTSAQ